MVPPGNNVGVSGWRSGLTSATACEEWLSTLRLDHLILAAKPENAIEYLEWGYKFVAISVDLGLLLRAATQSLADVRKQI